VGIQVSDFAVNIIFQGHTEANVCGNLFGARAHASLGTLKQNPRQAGGLVHSGGSLVRQFNGSVCPQKVQWQRLALILALFPALLALNSCGGSSTTAATPTLTISCAATSVDVNGTVQCTQNILNLSSTLVNWQAGGVAGGNSTFGTIDTNGKYTAPQTVPTNNVVTITAIAQAQTSLTATATITILPATAISAITCLDSTQTPSLTVKSGTSLACTATSSANTPIAVFWQVNTITGGNGALGNISAQGNYVAPLVPPAGGTITITAISQAVSTQTMSVTVNVTFGNRVLSGSYAFSTSGRLQATNGFSSRVGSFVSDGNGGLTGLEDVNPQPGTITTEPISFSGSYSIGPDGRGTMHFCEPSTGNACTALTTTTSLSIVVISPQQAQIIDFQTGSAAGGEIVSQPDTSVFKTGGLSGGYAFSFSGISSGTTDESVVGEFVSDGAGKITSGELDTNIGGAPTSQVAITNTSTYTVDSRGRGVATLNTSAGTFKFVFYMISASRAKFLETDAAPILVGDSFKQQSIVPWGPNSLNGNIVFQTSGTNAAGAFLGDVGTFTSDGTANITAGLLDQNNGGTVTSATPFTGTYTVDVAGRGTITIPSHTYVLYMISAGNAVLQETTASIVAHGSLTQPQGGPFSSASLSGSYALSLAGQNAAKQEEDIVGQLSANGTGNVTAASLDINNFGTLTTGQTAIGTYTAVAASSGRTTVLLNPTRNLVLYLVSPTQAYALDTDTTAAASGSLNKQF
jgi:hypothetical protein